MTGPPRPRGSSGSMASEDDRSLARARQQWVEGLEERARDLLPEPVYRYVAQGAGSGIAAAEASRCWDALRVAPRVLRDVSVVDTSTSLLGTPVSSPLGVAPTTLQRAVHPEGEVATARAVAAAGSVMVVSSNAGTSFAEIGATGVVWWLQAYLPQDRDLAAPLLRAAVEAGARAVVLTVDTPVVGTKPDGAGASVWDTVDPAHLRANHPPGQAALPGADKATDLGPADVAALSERTGLPVVVKGVLRADDARRCLDAGAAAIWVSNHGGRQLAQALSTAEALPEVSAAVGQEAEVYVDGGVRTGLHTLLALGLGARAAFVGRAPVWALACGGEAGVTGLLEALQSGLTEAMRVSGCASLTDAAALGPRPAGVGVPPAPEPATGR